MSDTFDEAYVAHRGLRWARNFAETLLPEHVGHQIREYEIAHEQAEELVRALKYFREHSASLWSGAAADLASQKVARALAVADRLAQALHTTKTALNTVRQNAEETRAGIAATRDLPHQVAVRACASHLNSLASSYGAAAAQLSTVHRDAAPAHRNHPAYGSPAPGAPAPASPPAPAAPFPPAATTTTTTSSVPGVHIPATAGTRLAGAGTLAPPAPGLAGAAAAPPNGAAPVDPPAPGFAAPYAAAGLGVPGGGSPGGFTDPAPGLRAPRRGAATSREPGVYGENGFEDERAPAPPRFSSTGGMPPGDPDSPDRRTYRAQGGGLFTDEDTDTDRARSRAWPEALEDEESGAGEQAGWVAPAIGADESLLAVRGGPRGGRRRVLSVYDTDAVERELGRRTRPGGGHSA